MTSEPYPFNYLSISIAISTKDRRDNLARLLESITNLNYPRDKIEVVVVEEGDKPLPIQGVKYFFIPRLNKGFGYTRNMAVSNCSHDLIAFVDDDCEVTPDWLNELLKGMGDDTKIAGVTGGVMVKDCNAIGYCENLLGFPAGGLYKIHQSNNVPQVTDEIVTCNALIRKSAILDVGGFNETGIVKFGGEDSLLSYSLVSKGYLLFYSPSAIVYHKTKDNLKNIFKWALRMGKSRIFFNKIIDKRNNLIPTLRTSIFVKLLLLILGLIVFQGYILPFLFIVLTIYWLRTIKKNIFCKKYIANYIHVLLVLPIVKFLFDLGTATGQLIAIKSVEKFKKQ